MLHLLKYQFLQTIRSRSIMFWALAFPLILGTLFYVSFGNTGIAGTGEPDWEKEFPIIAPKKAGGNIRHLLREVGSFPYHCFQWH